MVIKTNKQVIRQMDVNTIYFQESKETERTFMNVKLICDLRENFEPNMIDKLMNFNDHPPMDNIEEIQRIITQCGYQCEIFGGIPELIQAVNDKMLFEDSIFLNLTDGLDMDCGRVQAPILLDILNVFYSGADPFQAALIDNKYYTKLAVKNMGISIPESILIHKYEHLENLDKLHFPLIVKPNSKGSSIGINQRSICHNKEELQELLLENQREFDDILVEQFIPGYEVTNFIIGNNPYYMINEPVLEEFHGNFIHNNEVMAIEDKAYRTRTFHACYEILGNEITEKIKQTTQKIKEDFGVNDILRIDYRITTSGEIYFLEANTVPRICSKNEAGFICKFYDKPYSFFLRCLLDTLLERYNKENGVSNRTE